MQVIARGVPHLTCPKDVWEPYVGWKILESLEFLLENIQEKSWKMTLVLESPGNLLAVMWIAVFWLQIDMFLQTKIAIIVATRYVFWAASMPKTLSQPGLHPRPRWWSLKTSKLLSVAIFIHRWLTMECFVTNRVGTLGKGMLATAYKSAVQKVSAQLISTCRDSTKVNFEIKIKR